MHYQNQLFNTDLYQTVELETPAIYDPAWDYTEPTPQSPECVLEQVAENTNKVAPEQYVHWVEQYSPSNRKKYKYYRYCWMIGRKIKHLHIPGGNVNSPLVNYRKEDIEDLIAIGEAPDKIVEIIKKQFN